MTSVQKNQYTYTNTVSVEVEHFSIVDNICAVRERRTTSTSFGADTPKPNIEEQQKLFTTQQVSSLLKGKKPTPMALQWMSPEAQKRGQLAGFDAALAWMTKEQSIGKGVFDWCLANPATAAHSLIHVDHSAHLLFDHNKNILPTAIFFDYISSHIDETSFDLHALARHLLQRADVFVLKANARKWGSDIVLDEEDRRARTAEEAVMRIPHYNAEAGRSRSVEFVWQPSVQDFRQVWNACTAGNASYPSTKIRDKVFALDILGLQKTACTPRSTTKKHGM